jgi:hypothetical protein
MSIQNVHRVAGRMPCPGMVPVIQPPIQVQLMDSGTMLQVLSIMAQETALLDPQSA